MAQLSDTIEKFIKDLMEEETQVELRRNELMEIDDISDVIKAMRLTSAGGTRPERASVEPSKSR